MMFEAQRKNIDVRIDDLVFSAYDAGWNAAIDIFTATIKDKQDQGDEIAVKVLRWALAQMAEEMK
jgi:N-acetylglucosamine kinase-like BadF-type ATPase